jgi:hypothetical protein
MELSHPSDKNKYVARVGHPAFVAENHQLAMSLAPQMSRAVPRMIR